MPVPDQISDAAGAVVLSIAVIDPDDQYRKEVAGALAGFQGTTVREYSSFPADLDDLPQMLEKRYDVVLIGIDSDPEYAFDVVESICSHNSTAVMVYSAQTQLELAIRFMRAGAREFLTVPLLRADIVGALARASIRRSAGCHGKRGGRRLFVFLGSKGGCGVTTIAANFAVALAQESGQRTLLIDFGLPLGDAAINLGMASEYSTANALHDSSRLDPNFLRSLLAKHSSGLCVLAAPGEFSPNQPANDAIDKLLTVARQSFDYVVVDAGSRIDLRGTALFDESASVYLITQVGVSELRNSNRLIARLTAAGGPRLEVVLNRYDPKNLEIAEEHIARALTRQPDWKIPNNYAAVRRMQNTAVSLMQDDSEISQAIRQMVGSISGQPTVQEKKKGFRFFR